MAEDTNLTTGTPEADGNVQSGTEKEQAVPYKRFKEVNDGLAEFKKLGLDPSEIAQELRDYRELVVALKEETTKGDSAPKDSKKSKLSAEKQAEIKEEMEMLFPGLSKLQETEQKASIAHDAADATSRAHISSLQNKASQLTTQLVTDNGYAKEAAAEIETLVANRVYGDAKLQRKFLSGDMSVVQEAFDEINESFLSKHLIRAPKSNKKDIPSLLSGNKGLSVDGTKDDGLTEEKLAKMNHQERKRAIGKDAFDFYNTLAQARAEARGE